MKSSVQQSSYLRTTPGLVWLFAALFPMFQFMMQASPSVLASQLAENYHFSKVTIGFFSSVYFYSYLIFQIPAGLLIDRVGARYVLLRCMPISILLCLIMATTHSGLVLFITRLLLGVFTAPAMVSVIILASHWFSPKRFALLAGLTESFCIAGGGVMQKIMAEINMHSGWQGTILSCVGFASFVLLMVYFFVQDRPEPQAAEISNFTAPSTLGSVLSAVIKTPGMLANGLFAGFIAAFIGAFAGMWGVEYLQTAYHISLGEAATGTALTLFGVGISCVLIGWASDMANVRKPFMYVGAVLTTLFFCLVLFTQPSLNSMYCLLFLIGLSSGSYTLCFVLAKESVPVYCRGAAAGFINMMSMCIGAPLMQPLIGELLEIQSHGLTPSAYQYELALSVLPVGMVFGIICLFFVKEQKAQIHSTVDHIHKGLTRAPEATTINPHRRHQRRRRHVVKTS